MLLFFEIKQISVFQYVLYVNCDNAKFLGETCQDSSGICSINLLYFILLVHLYFNTNCMYMGCLT